MLVFLVEDKGLLEYNNMKAAFLAPTATVQQQINGWGKDKKND